MRDNEDLKRSSGNIFADLGLPDPETSLTKAHLVLQINAIVEQQGWTDTEVAEILGIPVDDFVAVSEGAALSVFTSEDFANLRERLEVAASSTSVQRPRWASPSTPEFTVPMAAGSGGAKPGGVSFD